MRSLTSSYDSVPYESYAFPQTQPDRLSTIARLFSIEVVQPASARVLEIGCAAGGNLLPLAYRYPDAKFVGIDISRRQIEDGQRHQAALGLKNVQLIAKDLMDVDESLGQFDYIIAHGVYSWVPHRAREKLLVLCGDNLSEKGMVYVSYNTNPGWRMRGMVRDMMTYHIADIPEPLARVSQARALLEFLQSSLAQDTSAYATFLREESLALSSSSDNYIFHDHLEENNQPVYFHEFMEQAEKSGLQYFCDEEIALSIPEIVFRPETVDVLRRISADVLKAEQYSDFLLNRTFRRSLLVGADRVLNRSVNLDEISSLFVETCVQPATVQATLLDNSTVQYAVRSGVSFSTSNPVTKVAFDILGKSWPETIAFADLYSRSCAALGESGLRPGIPAHVNIQSLATDLWNAFCVCAIGLHSEPSLAKSTISERPTGFPPAVYFASLGQKKLPNARHESIELDDFTIALLSLLDGTRDHSSLESAIVDRTTNGRLVMQENGETVTDIQRIRSSVIEGIEVSLARLKKMAFLVG